jgi:hypothetical protein
MSTKKKDPVVPVVVGELMQESRKIEAWIEGLADHADEEYTEVFERVRTDYRGRLDSVTEDLKTHRPDLVSSLEDHQGTADSLRGDRDSHKADMEEGRLRHAVGELSEEQWVDRRTTIEVSLDKVASVLTVEEGAVSELSSVLESVDRIVGIVNPPPLISRVLQETVVEKVATPDHSWSQVLSTIPEEDESQVLDEDEAEASEDELAFLETISADDFKRLDPINAAFLNGG